MHILHMWLNGRNFIMLRNKIFIRILAVIALVAFLAMSVFIAVSPLTAGANSIQDAQRQHQELSQQAAAVIGNQRQLEMQLNRRLGEIEKLQGSKTMIIIAHRLTTVQHCDNIYEVKGGKVIHKDKAEIFGH